MSKRRKIDEYREIVNTTKIHAKISELIGMKFTKIEEGRATFELDCDNRLFNSLGVVQGGVLTIMADAAMGLAFGSLLDADQSFSTVELKINFFRPVKNDHLVAVGKVINKTKRTGYVEAEIRNSNNKLVAKAVSTCLIIS
ncbi:MAG: PaaI family thioesterase [Promethearchaeota archaeon]